MSIKCDKCGAEFLSGESIASAWAWREAREWGWLTALGTRCPDHWPEPGETEGSEE